MRPALHARMRAVKKFLTITPDSFVTSYSSYATGLAAVTDGQSFAAPIDTYRDGVWLRTAGVGVMTGAQPHDQTTGSVRPTVAAAGSLPGSPLVDFDSVDGLWGVNELLNRASGAAAPTMNLLYGWNGSRTYFLSGGMSDTTLQTDSQGGTSAARLTHASAAVASTYALFITTLPPGQWTFQFDAYVANGTAQTWNLATNSTTGLQSINITTTKQTFSGTITISSGATRNVGLYQGSYPSAAAAAGDIFIENVRIVPGAAAQSGVQDQNTRVGYWLTAPGSSYTGTAGAAGTLISSATSGTLAMKPASALSTGTYTLAFCANLTRPSAASNAILYAATATMGRNTFMGHVKNTDASGQVCDALTYNNGGQTNAQYKANGYGMQVHVLRVTPSGTEYFVDGKAMKSDTATTAIAAATYLGLMGGISSAIAAQWPSVATISGVALWNSSLSNANIVTASTIMKARLAAKSTSKTTIKAAHLAEGDSITYGTGDTTTAGMGAYASRAHDLLTTPRPLYRNEAIFGATLLGANGSNSLMGRQQADLVIIADWISAGWTPILTVLIGTNDGTGITTQASAETYVTNLLSYVATMRAAGAKVIVCTQLPYGSAAAYSDTTQTIVGGAFAGQQVVGWRGYIRLMLLAATSSVDAIADIGGNATFIQPYAASTAAGYLGDVAHPTPLGHSVIAGILGPVIQSVVNALP